MEGGTPPHPTHPTLELKEVAELPEIRDLTECAYVAKPTSVVEIPHVVESW